MTEELNQSNPQPSQNQPKPEKAENLDSRLPYKPPTLRKHGKVSADTNNVNAPGDFDFGFAVFGFADLS